MSTVDLTRFKEMLALQDSLNTVVDPEWRTLGWDWKRAIWLECAEAVEKLPWKWWKKTTPDEKQVQLEVVDIWHFVMSHAIALESTEELLEALITAGSKHDQLGILRSGPVFNATELIKYLEDLANEALSDNDEIYMYAAFFSAQDAAGLSMDNLYTMYIGKNVLNKFRQDNGYKKGTYIKTWAGVEDNEALMTLVDDLDIDNIEDVPAYLYDSLIKMYATVVKNATV